MNFIHDNSNFKTKTNGIADKNLKEFDIYAGVEYIIKLTDSDGSVIQRNTPKLTTIEPTNTTITTAGEFNRTGRSFVCHQCVNTVLSNVDKNIATNSCYKLENGTQYKNQKLSIEVIRRICASKKMAKFLRNTVPMLEEELEKNIILEQIL